MVDKKMPEPMDSGAPERDVAEPVSTYRRACYAAKTLIAEVLELFPETEYQVAAYNGRDVGLAVSFDAVDEGLRDLLRLVSDHRIYRVEISGSKIIVAFHNRPRIYDLRDPFGLDEAWSVLEDDWDGGDAFDSSDDIKDGGGA